jgi:GT2 family glycosyltransferase
MITGTIVLYHNDRNVLRAAIDSFLNTTLNVKLFLVDNSSNATLQDVIFDERVEYFKLPQNIGFGAAHNFAIKKALELDSEYHLVLNPDIYFLPGIIEKIVSFMEVNKEVGHLMPKVLYPNGDIQHLCKMNPTVFDLFARRFLPNAIQKLFISRMARYDYQDRDYNQIMYNIPYLSGCFMFLRVATLKKVGFFDERIFMYIEDADLTRRFLAVSKTVYFPEVSVFHHFAKGSHKSWKLTWYSIHGAFVYFKKWGLRLF